MLLVYSKEQCSRCETLKWKLAQKKIPHTMFTLDKDYTREELKQLLPATDQKMFPFVFDSNGFIFMPDQVVQQYIDSF